MQKKLSKFPVLWIFIVGLFVNVIVITLIKGYVDEENLIVIPNVIFAISSILFVFKEKISLTAIFGNIPRFFKDFLYIFLYIFLLILMMLILGAVFYVIFRFSPNSLYLLIDNASSKANLLQRSVFLDILFPCLFAPIIEEFFFRGLILQKFMLKMSVTRAIIFSSIIFALVHFHAFIFIQFFFAIFVSIVYIKTHSLFSAIIIHIINNNITVFMFYNSESGEKMSASEITDLANVMTAIGPWLLLCSILGLIGLLFFLKKIWPIKDSILPYQYNITQ
ncbi:CPBP family intramembrane glutamic endopeptidase [Collimonas arenae]|uniref:CPBP family intramembrane glutamic endopeptidase n=1 Tax=Collimonas arenae TaxID=279058 RepID=UPI00056F8774|nr:type II CAAX endopeptidase family protein [Collimonas arenae]